MRFTGALGNTLAAMVISIVALLGVNYMASGFIEVPAFSELFDIG